MAENTGGAALDNSPSLAAVVGEMFGDFSSVEPETDAGAPPAASPDEPAERSSEGAATAEQTDEPSVAAAVETTPDAAVPQVDTDPLEGASPLSYVVDGESRTFDGITVLKDGGAIIDPDALAVVQRKLGERDHLFERSQETHKQYTALERATEWKQGDTVLRGAQAIEARNVAMAQLIAEVSHFRSLISNPENLRDILTANEDGSLAWNPLGMKAFHAELRNLVHEHASKARAQFASSISQPEQFNPQTFAGTATSRAIELAGAKGLTDADRQWAEALAPRFIRLATPADAQANPSLVVGKPMVEQQFLDLVKDRAAQRAETAKVATTAVATAKENQARVAAASVGKKPTAPAKPRTPQPTEDKENDFDTAWDAQEKASAGAMRFRQTAG